nr:hypothetical protein [Tanacetum cinerariifolium]
MQTQTSNILHNAILKAGSKDRPPMLAPGNYIQWKSRIKRYIDTKPNHELINYCLENPPYELDWKTKPILDSDGNSTTLTERVFETYKNVTQEIRDQLNAEAEAVQIILTGIDNDIYSTVDACPVERLAKTQDPLALMANSNNPYVFPAPHQDQSSFNQNYLQQPMPDPEDITDPTTAMNMALALMAKAFKLNYSTPTNNNQRISSNPRNRQIAQPGMNKGQDRQMQMVGGNGGNQFRQYAGNLAGYNDVIGNQVIQNAVQNPRVQNVVNPNGLIGVQGNRNQNNLEMVIMLGTVPSKRRDAAYLQTQLLIAQKEEAGIQLQAEEYDLMAAAADLDEIEEVNANCILMANLQQASTSGTQTDSAPVYDTDGSAEVHENYDDNEIFNMFTQEEQYTELLEPIPESHQVLQNDNDVISEDTSVEQGGETVEQHPVNRKLKETNADLTTKLARFKNQESCFEISQEKYDKLERCYQESVYQEQCLSKKINALHLSTGKQIMTFNEQISKLNKQLSKEKSTVSFLLEEKKRLKSDFKTCKDKLLDKQILLEKRIKELNNIVLIMGQSIQTIHMLSPKPNSFYHTEQKMALGYQNPFYLKQAQKKQQSLYDGKVLLVKHDPPVMHDSEETLQLAQESHDKMKQMNKEIKPTNYTKINHLSGDLSDDTTPSVARKFLNEVKSTIVTLQRVVKQRMTIETHNWASSAHQELHKIIREEIFPIVNQVDARVQNFKIQFSKEAAKFVGDFKSLANEADASIAKHKALEL